MAMVAIVAMVPNQMVLVPMVMVMVMATVAEVVMVICTLAHETLSRKSLPE
jgi:hypothetical protein